MQIHRKGGESYFVEVCSKLGCHLPNDLVGWENGRMIVPYIVSRAAADRTLAPQRPRFQIIESRQKVFLCCINDKLNWDPTNILSDWTILIRSRGFVLYFSYGSTISLRFPGSNIAFFFFRMQVSHLIKWQNIQILIVFKRYGALYKLNTLLNNLLVKLWCRWRLW